jgi:hypothetical protein
VKYIKKNTGARDADASRAPFVVVMSFGGGGPRRVGEKKKPMAFFMRVTAHPGFAGEKIRLNLILKKHIR